ncbi:MAG: hypothetical protein ACNA8W_07555, partial [Bradymonadaceae bacterium]
MAGASDSRMSGRNLSYPAPTLIIGVGRFGLAVLERLGEDWMWLSTASAGDASLKNLRLMHVAADGSSESAWRGGERSIASIARYVGDDERPSLALNWAILRALGLIRYHDGIYQVAQPRDEGVVAKDELHQQSRRIRFFQWINLSADPLSAAERLSLESQRSSELDSFLTPILERVRHGDSPRLLLHCISRLRALCEGRDPSPWPWLIEEIRTHEGEIGPRLRMPLKEDWLSEDDRLGLLAGIAPEPLTRKEVVLPRLFLPQKEDLPTPLDPLNLLRVDWESTGWAADEIGRDQVVEFHPLESSLFRLGFFDHDGSSRVHDNEDSSLPGRLEELGRNMHRGL